MLEFLQAYGVYIGLGVVMLLMMRMHGSGAGAGGGCCGGSHQHETPEKRDADTGRQDSPEPVASGTKHGGSCH